MEKLISKIYGKYHVYEIREKYEGSLVGHTYILYKNGSMVENFCSVGDALEYIKKEDPSVLE